MWEVEWGTYVTWNKETAQGIWKLAGPPSTSQCNTLDDFVAKYLRRENEFTRCGFRGLNPDAPLLRLHSTLGMMGIGRQHWTEAIRLLKEERQTLADNTTDTL